MDEPSGEPDLDELLERAARYAEASLLGKAALQLRLRALDAREREVLRRHTIGPEGRIAEDALRAVRESEAVWPLLTRHDLPEDASPRELDEIHRFLVGRPTRPDDPLPHVSIRAAADPLPLAVVTGLLVDVPGPVTGYRYAALAEPRARVVEPFLVLLRTRRQGGNRVLATLHLGPTFLRYEQELGLLDADRVQTLATIVAADAENVRRTRQELERL